MLLKLSPTIIQIGNLSITWYAIFVIGGAVLAYLLTQYFAKKGGYSKNMIETLFYLAFPLGIVGARIWFVLSNLNQFQGPNWYHVFFMWEGGLAIQGGVVLGVIVALIYLKKKWPQYPPLAIFDLAVPNILIAQSIGRWGNFFNQEVYGACVSRDSLSFLPNFILDQMAGGGGIACGVNEVAQPLFLYEGLLTLLGFIVISILMRKFWIKNRPHGILTMGYFVWYGIIRACLEPLRNEIYIMQINGVSTSLVTSIVYAVVGVLGIIAIYIYNNKRKKNQTVIKEVEEDKKD